MEANPYVGVIIDLSVPAADKIFHYRVPERLQEVIRLGDQVMVPFQHRRVLAYVVALPKEPEAVKLKDVIRVTSPGILDLKMLKIAFWLALRYNCYLIEAIRCLLPPGEGRQIRGKQEKLLYLNMQQKEIQEVITGLKRRAPKQARVLEVLAQAKSPLKFKEVAMAAGVSPGPIIGLIKKGLVDTKKIELLRNPTGSNPVFVSPPPEHLTGEQEKACKALISSLEEAKPRGFLLHGVTGSGKTEVYIQTIAHCLKLGKGALVLVPEIALTPQMAARFQDRFGRQVALLHSRLSLGERYDEWMRVRRGEAMIVIGARSAIFAPVQKLGLIILDEEHETSYKQEENPKYQTREVASFRAREAGATLVLGSATPGAETYYKALQGGYKLLPMHNRVDNHKLPKMELVDMRLELEAGNRSIFSHELQHEIAAVLERKEQAILFLNQRGFASFLLCRQCGYVATCPECDVSLTYHNEGKERLLCHYCFFETSSPHKCPVCSSTYIRHFGLGTEQVQLELGKLFPGAKSVRLDTDTTRRKDSYVNLLQTFASGQADILIGTQMVAKGLDFPRVTLVGIVSADTALNFPDFRAGERTFQLITQVAGRAGRGELSGRVIIQTYNPEHYSIQTACNHDYQGFLQQELAFRKRYFYPPFSQLVNIIVSSKDGQHASQVASRLAERIKTLLPSVYKIYGPGPAPRAKLRGKYRYQIMLKGTNINRWSKELRKIRKQMEIEAGKEKVSLSFDFAPVSLL
ncbi:MAG: primosomal protein N' [bacterium]